MPKLPATTATEKRHAPAVRQQEMAKQSRGFVETLKEEFREARSRGFEVRKWDENLAMGIIYAMETGMTFDQACRANDVTPQSARAWKRELPSFAAQIDEARIDSYEAMESRCYRIMDGDLSTGDRQRDRDLVKTIQWNMERRGRFQQRVQIDATHSLAPVIYPDIRSLLPKIEDAEFRDVDPEEE